MRAHVHARGFGRPPVAAMVPEEDLDEDTKEDCLDTDGYVPYGYFPKSIDPEDFDPWDELANHQDFDVVVTLLFRPTKNVHFKPESISGDATGRLLEAIKLLVGRMQQAV
ncbi:hypothetical protein FNV43_RR00708 [Rhamnella rubrinervis]|uniref:Uncharacterized protein n=1 Tax=Rhamnella rubrinervis TaxID=2594499 RepID=A0A8K0MSN7_9ROSA|nr:hypothetical protein FNV43_RR00708 [Rhamnella rubrinervis]